jgi:hypothetical protein
MNKIKFTISSHKNFWKHTYNIIIPSLLSSGVPNEDVYFFIGGANKYEKIKNNDGINLYQSPHNSIDFTGLISVIELNLQSDYWFLLHDTCYVGSNFYKYIQEHQHNTNTISLSLFGLSMNMGSYKQSYLNKIKDNIIKYKNVDDNLLQEHKKRLVRDEDIFLTKEDYYAIEERQHLGEGLFYGGLLRIKEYFPKIDLYKIKANWGPKPEYSLTL